MAGHFNEKYGLLSAPEGLVWTPHRPIVHTELSESFNDDLKPGDREAA